MAVQFFLKHDTLLDLLSHYDISKSGLHKGLVFTADFVMTTLQIGTPPQMAPQYLAKGTVVGVEGPYIDPSGDLKEIPGTSNNICPHPPPCGIDLDGNFKIKEEISLSVIADCYPQPE